MLNVLSRTYVVPNVVFALSFRQSSNLLLISLSFLLWSFYFRFSDERCGKCCCSLAEFWSNLKVFSSPEREGYEKGTPDHLIARAQYSFLIGSWILYLCIVMVSTKGICIKIRRDVNKKYSRFQAGPGCSKEFKLWRLTVVKRRAV